MRIPSLVGLAVILGAVPAQAAPETDILDPGFLQGVYVDPFEGATAMAWAPDGTNRLFVARQSGQVRIIEGGVMLPTPFALLSPIVGTGEMGLLGLVFDPNFAANHYLYVFVTVSTSEQQII